MRHIHSFAERLSPAPAEAAGLARQVKMAHDAIPGLHILDLAPDIDAFAGNLMAQNSRIAGDQPRSALHDDHCESYTCRPDADLCIARADTGLSHILKGHRTA
jgi:hypothetical protein